MKYLLITNDFHPNNIGGMTNYYTGLAQGFTPNSICVLTVNVLHKSDDQQFNLKIFRSNIVEEKIGIVTNFFPWYKQGLKIIKNEKIDVILCGNFRPFSYIAYFLNKKIRIPYYIFFHGNDLLKVLQKMRKNPIKKIFYNKIVKSTHGFVANSKYTASLIPSEFKKGKDLFIANPGVAQNFINLKIEPPFQNRDEIKLLTVGRLTPRKGVDKVIEALALLKKEFYNIRYDVVGKGDMNFYKSLSQKYDVSDLVYFHGFKSSKEMEALYKKCDIFIMVSWTSLEKAEVEGFGIVYLEANAFGKPVIGSNTGGISDAIEDDKSGVLVGDPLSAQEIADKIKYLCRNQNIAREMGRYGYQRVNEKFQYNFIALQLTQHIENSNKLPRNKITNKNKI